jgi:inner membrane transporter RhtA
MKSGWTARSQNASGMVSLRRAISDFTRTVPPSSLLVIDMITVQLGAAWAKELFGALGPVGTVTLRVGFAALILAAWWRPWRLARGGNAGALASVRRTTRRADYVFVALFGLTLAAMNLTFYLSLSRIPLGIAVTVEFIGPLTVAVVGSRRALDVLWIVLAVGGILLLAPLGMFGVTRLDPLGLLLALGAGTFWGLYILLTARVGRSFPGGIGLSLAMAIGGLALLPIGIADAGSALLNPSFLLVGAGVALLSSVIPYSLEIAALRRMAPSAFGVLMSLEPAIAALIGWLVLHETLELRAIVALIFITTAAIGSTRWGAQAIE